MKNLLSVNSIFILILFVIHTDMLEAQVTEEWVRHYNNPSNGSDVPYAMTVDNSGNVYVTGTCSSSGTGKDYLTIKYNSSGTQLWEARYNSQSAFNDEPRGIAVDQSGNVYVTGVKFLGGSDQLITTVKYNSSGIEQWARRFGDSIFTSFPGRYKSPIALDNSGNIYIAGSTDTYPTDNGSFLLIKYNASGDTVWIRYYDGTAVLNGLGSSISVVKCDGNFIYVAGKSFDMSPVTTYLTVIKYNLSGAIQWTQRDTLINGNDNVVGIDTDPSGNIFVSCNYGLNILTFKYSPSGARLWKTLYTGATGALKDEVKGIAADDNGNIILTGISNRFSGSSGDDFVTLKYDAGGNQSWEKLYNSISNSTDRANDVAVDISGNIYVTGQTLESFNRNYITIKYSNSGVQQWLKKYSSAGSDDALAIALDTTGNVFVTGASVRTGTSEDYCTIKYSQSVGVNLITSELPASYSLLQNYPNPFNPVTRITYQITNAGNVSLKIFDIRGNELEELVNERHYPGTYSAEWDASAYSSGVYFYRIVSGNFSQSRKMNLVK